MTYRGYSGYWRELVTSHSLRGCPPNHPSVRFFHYLRWDINIRMSTIIGFVGGDEIGFLLSQWIRLLDYKAASIAVWFIAITVAILDFLSAEVRQRFV